MSTLNHLIAPELAQALGWTLLHSLWQGALVALLLGITLIALRTATATTRYWAGVSALLLLIASSIVTFTLLHEPTNTRVEQTSSSILAVEPATQLAAPFLAVADEVVAPTRNHPTDYLNYFEPHLPLLVSIWLMGVLLLGLKMLGELVYLQHLKHYRCRMLPKGWQDKAEAMAQEMGIRRRVLLRETSRIHSPLVAGFLKPMILFPIGLLNQLTVEQVESILAHELAHIKRHDYLVNLLLSFIEVLFFFNPTAWWISRRIKAEREFSCDDLAIAYTGDAVSFVKSLAQLEEWRLHGNLSRLSMAFSGQPKGIIGRVQRILQPVDKRRTPLKALLSIVILVGCGILFTFQSAAEKSNVATELNEFDLQLSAEAIPQPTESPEESAGEDSKNFPAPNTTTQAVELAPVTSVPTPTNMDSLPEQTEELRRKMIALEKERQKIELEIHEKERALQQQYLQLEEERQEKVFAQRQAMQELEQEMHKQHQQSELIEHEYEQKELKMEMKELELEEVEHNLRRQRREMEENENLSAEERKQQLQRLHQKQQELLGTANELERNAREIELQRRERVLAIEQRAREIENRHFKQEQEAESLESELEMRRNRLEQAHELLRSEYEVKLERLESRMRPLEEKMERLEQEMEDRQFEDDGDEQ